MCTASDGSRTERRVTRETFDIELISSKDQVVSAAYDKIVRLWDVETGTQVRTFSGHSQSTLAVAFDPTGNMLASG